MQEAKEKRYELDIKDFLHEEQEQETGSGDYWGYDESESKPQNVFSRIWAKLIEMTTIN